MLPTLLDLLFMVIFSASAGAGGADLNMEVEGALQWTFFFFFSRLEGPW